MQSFKQILENWIVLIPCRCKKYLPNHNMNHKNILTNCLIRYKEHYIECFILHSILWQLVIRRGKLYLLKRCIQLWDSKLNTSNFFYYNWYTLKNLLFVLVYRNNNSIMKSTHISSYIVLIGVAFIWLSLPDDTQGNKFLYIFAI